MKKRTKLKEGHILLRSTECCTESVEDAGKTLPDEAPHGTITTTSAATFRSCRRPESEEVNDLHRFIARQKMRIIAQRQQTFSFIPEHKRPNAK